jgi:ketosteroid isomerase-like protein
VSEADVEQIRKGYAAFNRGDIEWAIRRLDEDVHVTERPEVPDADVHAGKEEVSDSLRQLVTDFVDYRMEEEEIIDLGGQVIAVMRQSGVGALSGVPVEGTVVHLWTVHDGRAVGLRAFSTREEALAEAAREAAP